MSKKTYPIKVEDGNVYAVITLRDVVENRDVSDLPILAEIKRLYTDNAKLRELVQWLFCELYAPSPSASRRLDIADRICELEIEVS